MASNRVITNDAEEVDARATSVGLADPDSAAQQDAFVCTHCGLAVPAGLVEAGAERQFCCGGCRAAYEIIHGCGLDYFYRFRKAVNGQSSPVRSSGRRYAQFDDPSFRRLYCTVRSDGLVQAVLCLENVHCAACVWMLEKLPQIVPGVIEARANLSGSLLTLSWVDGQVNLSRIAQVLETMGYPAHPARHRRDREARLREDRRFLVRVGIAAVCMANVMVLSFALYGGRYNGIEEEYANLFRWVSAGFGLVSLAWPGSVFFRSAVTSLRTRTPHVDLPIALALGVGGLAGFVNVITGRGEVYFDSLTMLVFLLLVSRWIHLRHRRAAGDSLELLFALTPTSARLVTREGVREVAIESVQVGEVVEVRAGESMPIDGVVAQGISMIDQSLLTGESRPVQVAEGEPVAAGTVNVQATLRIQALATGAQTRVGQLMALMAEAASQRAPIVQWADRIAGRFVVVVLILAAANYAAWSYLQPAAALDHTVALLVVTCPCALALATPLGLAIAIGRAARRSMLIKNGAAIEALARPHGTLLLDKTGTITAGCMELIAWQGDESVRPLLARIERESTHPVARALSADAVEGEASRVQSYSNGIDGYVGAVHIQAGSGEFLADRGIVIPPDFVELQRRMAEEGLTPVLVARDGHVVATAGLGDPVRSDAAQAIAALRDMGWQVRILSGDHPRVVHAVARQVGVAPGDVRGGAAPEDKLAFVRAAVGAGPVVMVGDGVNDAAAMAGADVGVAVHGGAEASLAAADVYISRPGMQPLVELVRSAQRTMFAIRCSFGLSLVYNVAAAGLAMIGWIHPLLAAVLMPVSSITVLTIVWAQRGFGHEHVGNLSPGSVGGAAGDRGGHRLWLGRARRAV